MAIYSEFAVIKDGKELIDTIRGLAKVFNGAKARIQVEFDDAHGMTEEIEVYTDKYLSFFVCEGITVSRGRWEVTQEELEKESIYGTALFFVGIDKNHVQD